MRPWVPFFCAAGAASALGGLAGACIDGGRASRTVLAGDDASTEGDAGVDVTEELPISTMCGPSPWVNVGIYVVALSLFQTDASSPLQGVQLTSPLCSTIAPFTSDEGGNIHGQISANTPFYARLRDDPTYIPMIAPEEVFDADIANVKIEMLPSIIETFLPSFDPTMPTIAIAVQHNGGMGACDAFDGVSFSVPNHPEAMVTYFTNDTIPKVIPNGTATSVRGLAIITGLAPNQLVTLAGTKSGCHVTFAKDTLTGRVPLENGYVSIMPAYVGN